MNNVPVLRALALLVQAQRALQRLALKPLLPKQSLAPRQLRGHLALADERLGHPRHQDLLRRKTRQCSNRTCTLLQAQHWVTVRVDCPSHGLSCVPCCCRGLWKSMQHTRMGRTHCAFKSLSGLLGVLSVSHQQSCQGYLALDLNGWQLLPTRSQGNMTLNGLHVAIPQPKTSF